MFKHLFLAAAIILSVSACSSDPEEQVETQSEIQADIQGDNFGEITVDGVMPPLIGGAVVSDDFDVAVGYPIPLAEFSNPDGTSTVISPDTESPQIIFFVAHWCPHCQDELEDLTEVLSTSNTEGIITHIVSTSTDALKPNYPPTEWIEDSGISEFATVHYDDESNLAGQTFGSDGQIPYTVIVDKDGTVLFRALGNAGIEGTIELYEILSGYVG